MTGDEGVLSGSARLALVDGVSLLRPDEQVFDAMLEGWRNQGLARNLALSTVLARERQVRAFQAHAGVFPWEWTALHADEWFADLRAVHHCTRSTLRGYQVAVRGFCAFSTDPAYEWGAQCLSRFGSHPVQIVTDVNSAQHVADVESQPGKRPFTRRELQDLFDYADEQVEFKRSQGKKGWMAAFRDATIFKTAYAFGTRRAETQMLDVSDFGRNPEAPEFGGFGAVHIRHGKAKRASPPKRRTVLTVWPRSVEALEQWFTEVRPLFGTDGNPAAWPSERAPRVSVALLDHRMAAYREAVGLDPVLDFQSLRRSYVTHLIEDGWDPRFVQEQVGHEHASTTSIYTGVSSDFRVRTLRRALDAIVADAVGDAHTHREGTR
ncbi:tyrosine-type recombinase/integrase [Cryobacterium frigoriphilum]|nr:site-specific integrase [Cryobacterium frigoriphilum]